MKTQMRCQKILSLVTLITAAITAFFALFFCSGVINEAMYCTTEYSPLLKVGLNNILQVTCDESLVTWGDDGTGTIVNNDFIGADALFKYTQSINNTILILAIVFLLLVAVIYITNCNTRRNYYITNYVAIGALVIYMVVFATVLLVTMTKTLSLIGDLDFTKWKELYEVSAVNDRGKLIAPNTHYSENKVTCILGIVLFVVLLVEAVVWVLNLIWKIQLMKGEKRLLDGNKLAEVA